jgi:hypothetical protein
MKQAFLLLALLAGIASAREHEQSTGATPMAQAASKPRTELTASAPDTASTVPAPVITEHVGKIWKMQECGARAAMARASAASRRTPSPRPPDEATRYRAVAAIPNSIRAHHAQP